VAIDTAGNRILGGGMRSRRSGIGARLSDLSTDQSHVLSELAAGPVAFRGEDGVPLQLTASPEKPLRVSLWNVAADSRLWESKLPLESDASFATNWNGDPLLALSADGRMAGAAVRLGDNKNAILVWDAKTGSLLRRLERDGSPLMTLTFDPAGSQL